MKHLIPLLAACALTSLHPLRASELDDLIVQVQTTKNPSGGVDQEAQKIAARISAIGAPAIPRLLPLLEDPNENVRELAAYILRDLPGLTEKDLPLLMASQVRDNGWIAPAIARIGTPEAITFLVNELVRTRQDAGQLNYAIELLGPKAIPELVNVYRRDLVWDFMLIHAMSGAFRTMDKDALPAVSPLLKIAQEQSSTPDQRVHAIEALGAIGSTAATTVPTLLQLRTSDIPEIREASSSAIKQIGTTDATALFLEDLRSDQEPRDKIVTIFNISRLGARGKPAGPALSEYVNSPDWDLRLEAVLSLGSIGYDSSTDKLIPLLNNKEDWRLSIAAARSLALLKSEAALPVLDTLAQTHWYPVVRQEAIKALRAIREGISTAPPPSDAYQFLVIPPDYEKGMNHLRVTDLRRHSMDTLGYFSHHPSYPPTQILVRQKDGALKYETLVGIPVSAGFLAGADRGEWGGGITFIDPLGTPHRLSSLNTQAIYRTQEGAIAVTGLAHLGANEGHVLKLHHSAESQWTAEKWRALPGSPRFSNRQADGTVLIVCYGGSVLLSLDGNMRFLSASEAFAKIHETSDRPVQKQSEPPVPSSP